jgi:hypothetical protein
MALIPFCQRLHQLVVAVGQDTDKVLAQLVVLVVAAHLETLLERPELQIKVMRVGMLEHLIELVAVGVEQVRLV